MEKVGEAKKVELPDGTFTYEVPEEILLKYNHISVKENGEIWAE